MQFFFSNKKNYRNLKKKEETLPKNLATSIKNEKFLNFFFKNLRRINAEEEVILQRIGVSAKGDEYPFVSKCGKEINFVRPADKPIVFHTLQKNHDDNLNEWRLCHSGTMSQSFQYDQLAISRKSNRMYHKLMDKQNIDDNKFGLLKSTIAIALSDMILPSSDTDDNNDLVNGTLHSGYDFVCHKSRRRSPIMTLPDCEEPGPWSLPLLV